VTISTSPSGTISTNQPGDEGVEHAGGVTYTPTGGFGPMTGLGQITITQACYPLCQSDSITLSISDTVDNKIASLTFLRSASGLVQTGIVAPHITTASGCYATTANPCAAPLNFGNTHLGVRYTWEGSNSRVYIGPWDFSQDGGFGAFTSYKYTSSSQDGGTYTVDVTTALTTESTTYMILIENNAGVTYQGFTVHYGGGITETQTGPSLTVPPPSCSITDPGCILRELFGVAQEALIGPVQGGINAIRSAAMAKQPFNFLVRAYDGVGGQIDRAVAAVTSTSTCPGIGITPPLRALPGWPSPSQVPAWRTTYGVNTYGEPTWYLLRCADLEPVLGSTWWQAIRGFLDPAIYLGFAYAEFRYLRPKFMVAA
jgi:hypothetical protein